MFLAFFVLGGKNNAKNLRFSLVRKEAETRVCRISLMNSHAGAAWEGERGGEHPKMTSVCACFGAVWGRSCAEQAKAVWLRRSCFSYLIFLGWQRDCCAFLLRFLPKLNAHEIKSKEEWVLGGGRPAPCFPLVVVVDTELIFTYEETEVWAFKVTCGLRLCL